MSSSNPPLDTTQATATLLRSAYNLLSAGVFQQLVGAGFDDLRPAHGNVMEPLAMNDGLRLTELARQAGMAPQSMGELVDDLVALGYVVRRPDPDDRRAKRIHLTRKGQANVSVSHDAVVRVEQELEQMLGTRRYVQLRRGLVSICQWDDQLLETASD
jgi:DNA-binding MarR family transcriptional regulator